MSPQAFQQQVTHFLAELGRCHDLCNEIRQNRKLGPTTDALDALQTNLDVSSNNIETTFMILRKLLGTRMELGDDLARNTLNRCAIDLESQIASRLTDIAYKKRQKSDPELPGFRELLKKCMRIEEGVETTIEHLGQRITAAIAAPKPQPPKEEKKKVQKPKADEVVISMEKLEALLEHVKNSWVETSVEGHVLYVNCYDEKKVQWAKPEGGFVKSLPEKEKKSSKASVDKESRRQRERVHTSSAGNVEHEVRRGEYETFEQPRVRRQENETSAEHYEAPRQRRQEHERSAEQYEVPRARRVREDYWDSPRGW